LDLPLNLASRLDPMSTFLRGRICGYRTKSASVDFIQTSFSSVPGRGVLQDGDAVTRRCRRRDGWWEMTTRQATRRSL